MVNTTMDKKASRSGRERWGCT